MSQPQRQRVITLLGSTSVGKSTICSRFTGKDFSHEYEPTIRNLFQRNILINGVEYELLIHDTAGLERHAQINGQYINSDGFILVYSTTDYQSFEIVEDIFNRLADELNRDIPLVLIGNKSDLSDKRKVPMSKGEDLAKKWRATFLETSALDGKNVENSFIALLKLIDPVLNNVINQNIQIINKFDKTSHPVKPYQTNNPGDYHAHKNGLTPTSPNKNICTIS